MVVREPEAIRQDIVEHLLWDSRVEGANIDVDVESGGKVVLTGSAPSGIAREAASDDAQSIPGTESIDNEIAVESQQRGPERSGRELQLALVDFLKLHSAFDSDTLEISVLDGVVNIRGAVNAWWKKLRAEELILEVRGVRRVQNELDVVPSKAPHDQQVAEEIRESIRRTGKADPVKIDIKVEAGRVTLSGEVDSWDGYTAAYNAAKYAHGVKGLTNQISIDRS